MSHHIDELYPKLANPQRATEQGSKEGMEFRELARKRIPAGQDPTDWPPAAELEFNRTHNYEVHNNGREPRAPFYSDWRAAFDAAYLGQQ